MTSKSKLFKSFAFILVLILSITSVSFASASELDDVNIGVAPVESSQSIIDFEIVDETIAPTAASTNHFYTLEETGAYIRQQMVNRAPTFEVSMTFMYEEYLQDEWGQYANERFIDEAIKHTANANEGDYIAYSFSRYSVARHAEYNPNTELITLTHTYTFTYYNTASEEAYVTARIPSILEEAGVKSTMSNFEKSKLIYQWMRDNVTYNVTAADATYQYSPYGAVKNGRAVCQGYSLLAYRLFMAAGIDCRMITGTVNGNNHAWLLAQMNDDMYYNMDIMYEDTFEAVQSSKPYKYLYRGSEGFGDFANHTYVRGNKENFKCSLFDYDTAEFDAKYPTSKTDYALAFAGAVTEITAPVELPSNYHLGMDIKTAMSKNGDIVFNINVVDGSGPVDVGVKIGGKTHPRFQYKITNIMVQDGNSYRPVGDSSKDEYQNNSDFSILLPHGETYKFTVLITDYGVKPAQTISNTYIFTLPANPLAETLDEYIEDLVAPYLTAPDYVKALELHDKLLDISEYDGRNILVSEMGVLMRGYGNAESYLRAYEKLLNACNISTYRAMDADTGHVFLCAKLDGVWTFIDIAQDALYNSGKAATGDSDAMLSEHTYFGMTIDMAQMLHPKMSAVGSDSTAASKIFANATSTKHNYFMQPEFLDIIAGAYVKKIDPLVEHINTSTSIPVFEHANEDVYDLYYPWLAGYLSSRYWKGNVTVVYNQYAKAFDILVAEVDHSAHQLVYEEARAATCEGEGNTEGVYCKTCEEMIVEPEVIPALNHHWDYYHKCKTCGKFDTTPGNLIFYGAKDDPVRAEYKIVDANSVQYYKCKAVEGMTDVKVADYIKIGGKIYYVTSMNPNCFADRKDLTSVHVGENITSIGAGVFKDQTQLVKITGFAKVKTIYSKAFYNCTKLEQIGNISGTVNLPLVTEIREGTFYKCRNITVIKGMNKVFSIGDQAFFGCNQLVQIGDTAKCLTLPSVNKIGREAFRYCSSVKTIYAYSSGLTTIKYGAFMDCNNLYSIKIASDKLSTVEANVFKGIASKATFYVHKQNVETYKALFEQAGFKPTMTIKCY